MDQDRPEKIEERLVAALCGVGDLDAVQQIYVSSTVADSAARLQRAMLGLLQAERSRRAGEDIESVQIPMMETWPTEDLLLAGMVIVAGAETAALTGDPGLVDFGFRLLQFWFLAESRRFAGEKHHA